MKKMLLSCFILLFATSVFAETKRFDFRDAEFGMSKEEVRSIETGELQKETGSGLHYALKESVYGLKGDISYLFYDESTGRYATSDTLTEIKIALIVPPTMDADSKYLEIKNDLLKYKGDDEREPVEAFGGWLITNNIEFKPGIIIDLF